jgi:hypothetical protein
MLALGLLMMSSCLLHQDQGHLESAVHPFSFQPLAIVPAWALPGSPSLHYGVLSSNIRLPA